MNVLIAGCGKIGITILGDMVKEGHNVTIMDTNQNVLASLTDVYDVMSLCGNGVNCEMLYEAGIENIDVFVATMGSDEANMMACFLAKRMGAKHTIARVRNPEYNERNLKFMKQHLDISIILNPEHLAAGDLFDILKLPSAMKVEQFSRRNFQLIELKLKDKSLLDGMNLIEVRGKYPAEYHICAVQRDDNIYIPNGKFVLHSGDKIGIIGKDNEIQKLFGSLGLLKKQAKKVMIVGGSRTAINLAQRLLSIGINVKIIDKDEKKCIELSERLPKAEVIHGDASQQELLLEEGLLSQDAFVTLTGIDEENILLSYFAASQNVPTVLSKVNSDQLTFLSEKLGLDQLVSPRKATTNVIISYVRALQNSIGSNIETLYQLMDDKVEALEFIVNSDSKLLGIPLKELSLRKNTLIAGIVRGRKTIIPGGNDTILHGDRVIIICADKRLQNLEEILA